MKLFIFLLMTIGCFFTISSASHAIDMQAVFEKKADKAPKNSAPVKKKSVIIQKNKKIKLNQKAKNPSKEMALIKKPVSPVVQNSFIQENPPIKQEQPVEQPKRKCLRFFGKECFFGD